MVTGDVNARTTVVPALTADVTSRSTDAVVAVVVATAIAEPTVGAFALFRDDSLLTAPDTPRTLTEVAGR